MNDLLEFAEAYTYYLLRGAMLALSEVEWCRRPQPMPPEWRVIEPDECWPSAPGLPETTAEEAAHWSLDAMKRRLEG